MWVSATISRSTLIHKGVRWCKFGGEFQPINHKNSGKQCYLMTMTPKMMQIQQISLSLWKASTCFSWVWSGGWNGNQTQRKCSRRLILLSCCIPCPRAGRQSPHRDALERKPLLLIHHHFLKGTKVSPSEYTPKTQIARIFRHSNLQIII